MLERLKTDVKFDVVENILETLRFRGTIFFRSELAAPWGISLAPAGMPRFHILLTGDCYVGADREDLLNVQHMEIVMFPNGPAHWIADQPGRDLIASERAGAACELGEPFFQQGEITHHLMCGLVQYDRESAHPLFDTLPHILHFPQFEKTDPIWLTVKAIDAQMRRIQNHGDLVVDRLTEALFFQLLNRYAQANEDAVGFIGALQDSRIHQALMLIHQQPDFDWSLSSLSQKIGMSRATLVRHFHDAIGMTPIMYIMNWRTTKAYNLIKYTQEPIARIAESVGFASARTLSKAFQRQYGRTPSDVRKAENER